MSAMTNILVKDDANPVVEMTFVPVTDKDGVPFWRTNTAGVPFEGQMRLWMSEEQVKSGAYKRTVKLEVPVMETLGTAGTSAGYQAAPKVAYVETHIHTCYSHQRSTQADRANSLKMAVGVLQGASSTTATGILTQSSVADSWKASVNLPAVNFLINGGIPT
jgi:hypothetical protein